MTNFQGFNFYVGNMEELPVSYLKVLAEQIGFISVFLGGISATILGTLIVLKKESKIFSWMIILLSLAAVSFIIAVFGMNKIQMVLAPDYPDQGQSIFYPRLVSSISFLLGIYSLIAVVGLSGWLQSKKIGIMTSSIGLIAAFLIFTLI